ncbi:MAG: RNA polymerase sigma factor [Ruminococcus sp.]|nr:RNA polymerase sigma factor [Ruminococcus sp.]
MEFDFKETVFQYKDMIYRIAYTGCGNTYDADDVVQDVFMSLYLEKSNFESEEHLKAWLIRVTVNRVKSHLRSFHIRKRASIEDYIGYDNTCDNVDEKLMFRQIREAVTALPYNYRIVVILYYYCGYSCSEIAGFLKINEPTVRTRLKRARERLKKQLKEDIFDE